MLNCIKEQIKHKKGYVCGTSGIYSPLQLFPKLDAGEGLTKTEIIKGLRELWRCKPRRIKQRDLYVSRSKKNVPTTCIVLAEDYPEDDLFDGSPETVQ